MKLNLIYFINYFQHGIIALKGLRFLQILDIQLHDEFSYCPEITSESICETFCSESRPKLLKLCLPRMIILSYEVLKLLLEMTPNLVHLCTTPDNKSSIEVSQYNFKY